MEHSADVTDVLERMAGKRGKKRPTAGMMAGLAGHVWSFGELFNAVLNDHQSQK